MAKDNCFSQVFNEWSNKIKKILSEIPLNTIDGQPLEYSDDDYQKIMNKLQQCSMNFEDFPIYPINESIANKLILDQLYGAENERPNF